MSDYGAMRPAARASLKRSNPKRFEAVKAEHERQESVLTNALKAASTYEQYKAAKADLERFEAGGDPWATEPKPAA